MLRVTPTPKLSNVPGYKFPRILKRFLLIIASTGSFILGEYNLGAIFRIAPIFTNFEI
jgi:hypothetical protein